MLQFYYYIESLDRGKKHKCVILFYLCFYDVIRVHFFHISAYLLNKFSILAINPSSPMFFVFFILHVLYF